MLSYNKIKTRKNNGFTLVELSIVMMVIGLLVSGILVGKDMIRAAELRSVTSEKDKIQTAVLLFQDKYQGLPGDLPNATDFWGTMPTGTCPNDASGGTGTQTCNGNGNAEVNTSEVVNSNDESVLFWQHLSNAGLIEGKYSGIWNQWGEDGAFYQSKLGGKAWWTPNNYGVEILITELEWFEGVYNNSLVLGATTGPIYASLTPSEAWAIDKKIDDGLPGIGKLVTRERNDVNCNNVAPSAGAIAETATYNLAYEQIACELEFKNMW